MLSRAIGSTCEARAAEWLREQSEYEIEVVARWDPAWEILERY